MREVERIAGVGHRARPAARARSRDPGCRRCCARRAVLGAVSGALSQSLNCTRSALKPGRVGVGDVVRDHVHGALLRGQAGRGDVADDVHAMRDQQAACHRPQALLATDAAVEATLVQTRNARVDRTSSTGNDLPTRRNLPGKGFLNGSLPSSVRNRPKEQPVAKAAPARRTRQAGRRTRTAGATEARQQNAS